MLISSHYLEQNRKLHEAGNYGSTGSKWARAVKDLCNLAKSLDVLDYGCGLRTLEKTLGFALRNYDPCIPGLDAPPEPADIVACTDVLEHIEPDCLDAVLDDIKRVTKRFALLVVASGPAEKVLPDGRNAHLIQEGAAWWLPKMLSRFHLVQFNDLANPDGSSSGFIVVVRKL